MKQKYSEKELKSKNRAQLMELVALEGIEIGDSPTNASICKQLLSIEVEEAASPAHGAQENESEVKEGVDESGGKEDIDESKDESAPEQVSQGIKEESASPAHGAVASVIAQRRLQAQRGIKTESSVKSAIAARRAAAGVALGSSIQEAIAARRAAADEKVLSK